MKVRALHRDYETRSVADLKKVGAHAYAQHPTTRVLRAVWIVELEGGALEAPIIWRPGEAFPARVRELIESGVTVSGHNAAFEQAIDTYCTGPRLGWPVAKLEQLDCTLARAAVQALPQDLDRACRALKLAHEKDKAGHRLMLQMCKPRKPRKGEDPGAILWHETPEQLQRLEAYCVQDVYAEIGLDHALAPLQPGERKVWLLDQIMNNRGVAIDLKFVDVAKAAVNRATGRADAKMAAITGGNVEKITQLDRLKEWAKWDHGVDFELITKKRRNGETYDAEKADREALEDMLDEDEEGITPLPPVVRAALELRLEAGRASVKKLNKFETWNCDDGRARGNLQYHAAGPGRWAGRGVQLQNMIRKGVGELGGWADAYRDMQELGDEAFETVWGSVFDVVSRMSRGAVIAAPGKKLIFGDYSNVEARGCVWTAKQQDQVELFASGGLIYEEMAASIFDKSVEEVLELHTTKRDIIPRFVGKETVLGCGYGMGAGAFRRNCKKKGKILLPEDTCTKAVYGWREKNWRVVEFWRELEDAAKAAIESPGTVFTAGPFSYRVKGKWLQCRLPSGRIIWYRRPSLKPSKEDIEALDTGERVPRYRWKIHFWGVNGYTKQWEEETTWGGKLLENCVQGMCRDFLASAMLRLEAADYWLVLSVHDEAIAEVPAEFGSVAEFLSIMTELEPWGHGFPLKAEGGTGTRYAKA